MLKAFKICCQKQLFQKFQGSQKIAKWQKVEKNLIL